ncbi:general substrate transporter [Xylariaceae sp. FL0016]|nr:general substrate transporter [Xylariaceae sp. FL0016]
MKDESKNALAAEHQESVATPKGGASELELGAEVVYGPKGVRGLVGSPYVLGAAFLASLGGFSFGYDQGVISIINVMDQFHNVFPQTETPFGTGFMTGMLLLGAFVGCLFMPYLADKISRKRALTVVVVIFDIGAIMQTVANSYGVLVAGRAIGGIGVGTLAMTAPLYISEISPPHLRGTLLVLESISIVSGVVIAFWITFATRHIPSEASFRLPLGLQMVCATLLGIGILFYPYSPRWLGLVGRNEECLTSLAKLRGLPTSDERVQTEYKSIIAEVQFQSILQNRRHPNKTGVALEAAQWMDLFRKKNWRRTVAGVGVTFFQQFMGVNAFIYYAPTLFRSIGQSDEMSLVLSGVFNCLQLVTVILCFFIIDNVGRRPLAIIGAVGTCVSYTIIAILSALFEDNWLAHTDAGWACAAFAFIFILFFGVSYSPLGWALPPEVFSNATRSKGVALATCVNWLANFIVGIATPPMIAQIKYGTYVFFAIFCFLAALWAFFLVPETNGRTLEQMDEVFGDTSGHEEQEIMQDVIRDIESRPQHV